jgi:SAM-dependent methyltransferase
MQYVNESNDKDVFFTSAVKMVDAKNYNDWTFDLFKRLLHGDVLEVGCGVGSFTGRIIGKNSFRKFLSIDIRKEAVEYNKKQFSGLGAEVQFRNCNLLEVEEKFDTIICMNVVEHIMDHRVALRHLLNLLNKNGSLFLLVPAHQFLFNRFDEEGGHFRRYCKKDVMSILQGFEDFKNYDISQYYFNIIGALGYWFVYKFFGKTPKSNSNAEIGLFDKVVVPIMRRVECRFLPFGISLVSIIRRIN